MSWITFEREPDPRRKTGLWWVYAKLGGDLLGSVKWYNGWRKFVFYPAIGSGFEEDCLREIATFCEDATRERKLASRRAA